MRLRLPLALGTGLLVLAAGAPARAQLAVSPESLRVEVPQGQVAESSVTVTNAGSASVAFCLSFDRPLQREGSVLELRGGGEACGELGEVLFRVDAGDIGAFWDPYGLTMTPEGRLFAAELFGLDRTFELTPELGYVREFEHPSVNELDVFPATAGVTYNADTGTLWWLNSEEEGLGVVRAMLLEGDLDGSPTGRRIELPVADAAPPPYESGVPVGPSYDPATNRYYFVDAVNETIWAVDTLGNTIPGYPVAQGAYPVAGLGNGVDAHGGERGGPEGVRIEVPAALPGDLRYTRVLVLDPGGRPVGPETPIPDLSDGTFFGIVVGNPVRSRLDPNGVMYFSFDNADTEGIVGIRPHPLPPSWLSLSTWKGTLGPGERTEITLTFSAGQHTMGTYTAALQVFEAETGAVVEVPLTLEVLKGTEAEPGPENDPVATLAVYPNPARGAATVALTTSAPALVRVGVYDVLGRRVALLHEGPLAAGPHAYAFRLDGRGLPAGVYVVRAVVEGARRGVRTLAQPLTLVRHE